MGEGTKPALVVLAAGMGSRYGGLKQIDPVDEHGNIIMDFSIYDAKEAGFEKVVFIIKKTIEKEFKENVDRRIGRHIQTEYVYGSRQRTLCCNQLRRLLWQTSFSGNLPSSDFL